MLPHTLSSFTSCSLEWGGPGYHFSSHTTITNVRDSHVTLMAGYVGIYCHIGPIITLTLLWDE